jgi:BolA protein
MASRYERISARLTEVFSPDQMVIEDESAKHAGHVHMALAPAGGETHYNVMIISKFFEGQSRVARSRAVHEALAAEFSSGLHALSLTLKTPDEAPKPLLP